MNHDDVKLVKLDRPFTGYFKVDRYTISHRRFEGDWTPPFNREVFERGHAVVVVLFDPTLDTVILVEQFRIGAYAAARNSKWMGDDESPWLVECVAGIIDEGETPEAVAKRESLEEAGCAVQALIPVQRVLVSPGGSTEIVYVFCGIADATNVGGVHGLSEENEDIRVVSAPAEQVFQWLDSGKILHSVTMIALYWLRENRASLRASYAKAEAAS